MVKPLKRPWSRKREDDKQLSFDFDAPPRRDIGELVADLIQSAEKLRAAYEKMREVAQDLCGCDLSDWDYETVEAYVDLAREHMSTQLSDTRLTDG